MNRRELRRYLLRTIAVGLQAEHRRLCMLHKSSTGDSRRLKLAILELESELWRKGTEYAKPGEVERVDKKAGHVRADRQLALNLSPEVVKCSKD